MPIPDKTGKQLRVTFLTTSFPRFRGDFAGNFVYQFARHLQEAGCRVRVIAPHDPRVVPPQSWSEVPVDHFRYFFPPEGQIVAYGSGMISRIRRNWLSVFQIPLFLISFLMSALRASRKSDCLHAFWFPSAVVALAVKAVRNVPVTVTLWGSDFLLMKVPGFPLLFRWLLKRADAVICESLGSREELRRLGIPDGKITIISNGIDVERFQPGDPQSAREALSLPLNSFLVLTVGRLSPEKGQSYLLEAIPEIRQQEKNVGLIFVGDGDDHEPLRAMTERLHLTDQVIFAGFQEQDVIPNWLNAADVLVLPSLSEGRPNIVMEAMACGLPIIATRVGGVAEMIDDGMEGLLIPAGSSSALAEKITALIREPELRNRLAENALAKIRNGAGGWQKPAAALKQVYESILPSMNNS